MDRKSKYIAIVVFSALIVAYESVAVEGALNTLFLDLFLVAAVPSIVGGLILVAFNPRPTKDVLKHMNRREWSFLAILSFSAALGVIMWYDAVGRIGASKEAILGGGSSEVLFVVFFSAIFLGERLKRLEIIGSILVLVGVFLVLVKKEVFAEWLGPGEIEAIGSSLFLAASAVMMTRMLRDYDVLPMSGIELLFSGFILLIVGLIIFPISWPNLIGWLVMIGLGLFPAISITTYYAGLQGIGASITSVLFSLNGILTVGAAATIIMLIPNAYLEFPQNIVLAIVGGIIAFVGVYLLNKRSPEEAASARMERITKV